MNKNQDIYQDMVSRLLAKLQLKMLYQDINQVKVSLLILLVLFELLRKDIGIEYY